MSTFPATRMRRLRRTGALRSLVRETRLDVADLVYPLFVGPASVKNEELPALGRFSVDDLSREAEELLGLGISSVILFGIPEEKDDEGSGAYAADGIVQRAPPVASRALPDLVLITDVCLCEYTSHGHCGVIEDGEVANDATLELLARTAVSHGEAGADVVAPSDMMDGRVAVLRAALDEAGLADTAIVSYAAKYASAFYGPFREAAESAPSFGDRRGYQMDPANVREACAMRARRRRGRRRADYQAGAPEPGRAARGARAVRSPGRRVQRLGRVRDGEGGSGARVDGRAPGGHRVADGDQTRGRGLRRHVLGQGARGLALRACPTSLGARNA